MRWAHDTYRLVAWRRRRVESLAKDLWCRVLGPRETAGQNQELEVEFSMCLRGISQGRQQRPLEHLADVFCQPIANYFNVQTPTTAVSIPQFQPNQRQRKRKKESVS